MVPPSAVLSSSSSSSNGVMGSKTTEEDDEFRRAQEMALAVAALGSSKKCKSMKAVDIRFAVADVVAGDSDAINHKSIKKAKERFAAAKEQEEIEKKKRLKNEQQRQQIIAQQQQQQKEKQQHNQNQKQKQPEIIRKQSLNLPESEEKHRNFVLFLLCSLWDETMGDYAKNNNYLSGKMILRGWKLMLMIVIINACIFFLSAASSTTSFMVKFCNAAFVINITLALCLTNVDEIPTLSNDRNSHVDGFGEATATSSSSSQEQEEEDVKQILPISLPKSEIKLEWLDGISFNASDLEALETLQPESTLAERRRFLKARKNCVKAASVQLGTYLQWRDNNRVEEFFPATFTTDEDDWIRAYKGAMEIANTTGKHVDDKIQFPRLVSVFEDDHVVCNNGARVVHVLPSQMDSNLAPPSTYALAVAMYLDRKLDRNYTEKVTVVIDIRFGSGWANPSSVSIVPFIKLVVGLLNNYFPERLSRCILFPLPRTATMLFNTAKSYLDPDTAAKIQVCSGGGAVTAPVPDKVLSFFDRNAIEIMEERRKSFFKK